MREIISRKDALAKGMNRYFTGKECKNKHIDERSVIDWACVSCRNVIRKKIHLIQIRQHISMTQFFHFYFIYEIRIRCEFYFLS